MQITWRHEIDKCWCIEQKDLSRIGECICIVNVTIVGQQTPPAFVLLVWEVAFTDSVATSMIDISSQATKALDLKGWWNRGMQWYSWVQVASRQPDVNGLHIKRSQWLSYQQSMTIVLATNRLNLTHKHRQPLRQFWYHIRLLSLVCSPREYAPLNTPPTYLVAIVVNCQTVLLWSIINVLTKLW